MKEDKYSTLQFQLKLLSLIPKNKRISSKELQERLQEAGYKRDLRSIQRHLATLCEQFEQHLDCDGNKPAGYKWKEQSCGLSLPMLNEQQSLVLMLAKNHLSALLPSNIMSIMEPFFVQAERNLIYDNKYTEGHQWLEKTCIVPTSQPLIPAEIAPEIFKSVSLALYRNKWLSIAYRNQKGKEHSARVMPLALAQQGASSYLVVQYENGSILHLALHRILSAEISTMSFERPQTFNLKEYISEGHFGFGDGKKIKLTFSIAKWAGFHLTETPLSKDQITLEEDDKHYRFQATLVDTEMLNWWLAKFGDEIWDIEKIGA
ncbi:WYL domain-containing protein [Canicola haemoglobinophilus]|uniref:Transcriptional regulator n=1 Tax=Canicola haemoglobinophilus TaxID=733 RepID=A0A1V4B047_9PAST|nr:WYL domain-containing protein [Canicola haemoglobinophilus]OOR99405.1 WYL domain-containing protein [Canicola haemoglobinophilus]STO60980.1 transcriptional regulator [Canicola haemoglobinophilus]